MFGCYNITRGPPTNNTTVFNISTITSTKCPAADDASATYVHLFLVTRRHRRGLRLFAKSSTTTTNTAAPVARDVLRPAPRTNLTNPSDIVGFRSC